MTDFPTRKHNWSLVPTVGMGVGVLTRPCVSVLKRRVCTWSLGSRRLWDVYGCEVWIEIPTTCMRTQSPWSRCRQFHIGHGTCVSVTDRRTQVWDLGPIYQWTVRGRRVCNLEDSYTRSVSGPGTSTTDRCHGREVWDRDTDEASTGEHVVCGNSDGDTPTDTRPEPWFSLGELVL